MCFSSPVDYNVHVKIRNSNFVVLLQNLGVCPFIKGTLFSTCNSRATVIERMAMYANDDDEVEGEELEEELASFFCKGTDCILDFVSHRLFVSTIQFCCYSIKGAIDNT